MSTRPERTLPEPVEGPPPAAFDAVADPVRRRLLEMLAGGECTAGSLSGSIQGVFGISQPAVSQHLRVLRDSGLVTVRVEGVRRFYRLDQSALAEVADWFQRFVMPWQQPLDALATELARGKRARRTSRAGQGPHADT